MKITMQAGAVLLTLMLSAAIVRGEDSTTAGASAAQPAAADTADKADSADATPIDFTTIDKDSSGNVSLEEAAAVTELHHAFAELDVDRNLALTPAEYAAWPRAGKGNTPKDPTTVPGGSAGAQHVPDAGNE